jgi:hypothetical protein
MKPTMVETFLKGFFIVVSSEICLLYVTHTKDRGEDLGDGWILEVLIPRQAPGEYSGGFFKSIYELAWPNHLHKRVPGVTFVGGIFELRNDWDVKLDYNSVHINGGRTSWAIIIAMKSLIAPTCPPVTRRRASKNDESMKYYSGG